MQIDPETGIARDARILIVDDQEANITMISQILGRAGYAICISISDPAEALQKFADLQPDLVLLDWHMQPDLRSGVSADGQKPAPRRPDPAGHRAYGGQFRRPPAGRPWPWAPAISSRNRSMARKCCCAFAMSCIFASIPCRPSSPTKTWKRQVRERTAELQKTLSELKEVQQQVIQQERLRALGAMAAGVAHDFNNSLMIIRGYSDMFTRRSGALQGPGAAAGVLRHHPYRGGRRAARSSAGLREFYRPYRKGEEDRRPVDLNALVREAMQLTRPKWQTAAPGARAFSGVGARTSAATCQPSPPPPARSARRS